MTRRARRQAIQATLRVVIFQDGDWLCAQCLEYDLATQARTLDGLRRDLERIVAGHVAASLKNGLVPFQALRPAPKKFWKMFERSRIPLPSERFRFKLRRPGVKLPAPEIRVAAAA